jgi:plastocyanin
MGVTSRRWVIGLSFLVALTLVLPGLNQRGQRAAAQDSDDEVTVEIQDFAFDSDRIEITVGTTVTWTNNGDAPHTVTADDESFGSDTLNSGESFSFTFTEVGEFAYHCAIHPRMKGVVVVTEAEEEATEEPEATAEETEEATDEATDEATEEATSEPEGTTTTVGDAINGSNALEYAGEIEVRGNDLTLFGYLTQIAGVETATLFTDDDPANWNESTARFTFFGSGTETSRTGAGESVAAISAEVSAQFFINTSGGGSFENPESFLSGTEIAAADLAFHYVVTSIDDDTETAVGDAALVWTSSTPFALDDANVQLGRVDGRHRLTYSGLVTIADDGRSITLAGSSVSIAPPATAADSATPDATDDSDDSEDAADEITVELGELNDSGMSGTATLRADGERTVVTLALEGATGDHPAHIHNGACNDLDPNPAFPLDDVDADGQSETTIEISLDDLQSEPFAVNIHKSVEEIGVYVACGNIESAE